MHYLKSLAVIIGILLLLYNPTCSAQTTTHNQWQQLFNGHDLTDWSHIGKGKFTVENNLLKTDSGMGILWYTPQKFGNCIIKVVYKTTYPTSNSGIFVRMTHPPKDEWDAVHHGYEIQILDAAKTDAYHRTGVVYSLSKAIAGAAKLAGEWNTMEIMLKGQMIRVKLNGILISTFDPSDLAAIPIRKKWSEPKRGTRPDFGYIGLQNEDHIDKNKDSHVYFKEVSVKPLVN